MIRFHSFERLGVGAAAISEKADGNCSLTRGKDVEAACEARRRVCDACAVDFRRLVSGEQVHGTRIACVDEADTGRGAVSAAGALTSTDGFVTRVRALPLALFVADCVPVYLFDTERRAGGLVHAGRRGTRNNISGLAVEALITHFDCKPCDIHALIGPSAGPCCYEVSQETASAFTRAGLPTSGRNLDLWQGNAVQLERAGVPAAQIIIAGLCTVCGGRFFSYRANRDVARNMALLSL